MPQIVCTLRATPRRMTRETANMLLMGQEARLPPNIHHPVEMPKYTTGEYIVQLKEREKLRRMQWPIEMPDVHPIHQPEDQVWLKSYFKDRVKGAKLQPKFIGPYRVLRALPYQVYKVEKEERKALQHEGRIKMYYASDDPRRKEERLEPPRNDNQYRS